MIKIINNIGIINDNEGEDKDGKQNMKENLIIENNENENNFQENYLIFK